MYKNNFIKYDSNTLPSTNVLFTDSFQRSKSLPSHKINTFVFYLDTIDCVNSFTIEKYFKVSQFMVLPHILYNQQKVYFWCLKFLVNISQPGFRISRRVHQPFRKGCQPYLLLEFPINPIQLNKLHLVSLKNTATVFFQLIIFPAAEDCLLFHEVDEP